MKLDKRQYLFIGIWFIINLLQSIFTGLHSDESYYWMYSQNLDWGYFDHPPMVAFLIYLGHSILPGEIGVRFLFIILSTATLALILNELKEKKDQLFAFLFVLSFPLIHTHISGFLAIPDIPLLFFTTLYIIMYKKFIATPSWKNSFLLSILIALMIYSKYHAFVVIGFTVFSNLKLLKNKYFYSTVILSILFLLPHIYWQVENNFPTFTYHLIERAKPFRLKYVFPNLIGQVAMAGPLTGVIVLWYLFKTKIENQFQRTLFFNVIGFYILFFVLSFKNRIEAHWISAVIPMLIFLTYPKISVSSKTKICFKRLAIPIIALLFIFRFYIALDFIPNIGHLKITFYNREKSALEIKKLAEDKKVGFFNNYAAASNYVFYTGDSIIHLSTPTYRFCQYDLWNDESYANNEALFTVQSKHLNPPNLTKTITGETKGFVTIDNYQSLNDFKITCKKTTKTENSFLLEIRLFNEGTFPILLKSSSEPLFCIMQNQEEIQSIPLNNFTKQEEVKANSYIDFEFPLQLKSINTNLPLTIYLRTKQNYRGDIISLHLNSDSEFK